MANATSNEIELTLKLEVLPSPFYRERVYYMHKIATRIVIEI